MNRKYQLLIAAGICLVVVVTVLMLLVAALWKPGMRNAAGDVRPTDFELTLERGPCFGFCPTYTVTVNNKGAVSLKETSFRTGNSGTLQEYFVTDSSVQKLYAQVVTLDFFNLKDEYVNNQVTDLPSTQITVTANGKTKSIYMYGLDDDIPQALRNFAEEIDTVLEVKGYLTGNSLPEDPAGGTYPEDMITPETDDLLVY